MSTVNINGSFILDSNLVCDGDININATGIVYPVPDGKYLEPIYSSQSGQYIYPSGKSRYIQSISNNISVSGAIDGDHLGFPANQGPGSNSAQKNQRKDYIEGYGAGHAGLGSILPDPGFQGIIVEQIEITEEDLERNWLYLSGIPDSTNVALNIIKGVPQASPSDFIIKGEYNNILNWQATPLEDDLEIGDQIRATYEGTTAEIIPSPKPEYGSFEAPVSLGSGSWETRGGGGIKLDAPEGLITVNGSIHVNGESGLPGHETGGASGGSVWINSWDIAGSGSIQADGGTTDWTYAGGGAGGYITVSYEGSYNYTGILSVDGKYGSEDGKVFIKEAEPIIEDRFTGKILNRKWWEVLEPDVTLNDHVKMDTSSDLESPAMQSLFSLQGHDITVDLDYVPLDGEPNFYNAGFYLWHDHNNWLKVSKRMDQFVGRYSVGGHETEVAVHGTDYLPATLRIHKNDSTFSFQYYDSTSTPQTIFSDVIPEFNNQRFKVRASLEKLASSASQGDVIMEYFTLNDENLANRFISLSGPPTELNNVTLSVIEGSYQYYGMDFYVEGNRLRWDRTGLENFDSPYDVWTMEYFTLTAADAYNKYVKLNPPLGLDQYIVPDDITLEILGGTAQEYGVDFYIHTNTNILGWHGTPLEPYMSAGTKIRVLYRVNVWYQDKDLVDLFDIGDRIRVMYSADTTSMSVAAAFDNFQVKNGVVYDFESPSSVVYVDPNHGSDTSEGGALTPLQNLFVATTWAKRGGTVILYDGTHNSASVYRKNLTIRGANGSNALITSTEHLDSTGSKWEQAGLYFYQSQSVVKNLSIKDATNGILAEYSGNIELIDNEIKDTTVGAKFVKTDPVIMRNKIHNVTTGVDFISVDDPYVYSNEIYSTSKAVRGHDTSNLIIQSNTIDDGNIGVQYDSSSSGIVASNNLTNLTTGISVSADSSPVSSLSNNLYGTVTPYTGTLDSTAGDFSADPLYVDQTGRDYHLQSGSPDINTGLETYDNYFIDLDGASRADASSSEVGAYESIDGSHVPGEGWFVSSGGNDFINFGGYNDPFRTLDRAMQSADSSVMIDGGHYDTFYLDLASQHVDLNQLSIHVERLNHTISYVTLNQWHVNNGYIPLPGIVINPDTTDYNMAINPLVVMRPGENSRGAGPAQEYGTDFVIERDKLSWRGLGMDGILEAGDILRIIFFGSLEPDAQNTYTLHPHYSNIDINNTIFVSSSGSDSTVLGGDGTNSGGDGSLQRPYRTVDRALQDSSSGDSVVVLSGEYPTFTGSDGRVLVPLQDKTSVSYKGDQKILEDLFWSDDFRRWNHVEYNDSWNFSSSGDSSVFMSNGIISMTFDGTNAARADSSFLMAGNFETSVSLRNAFSPLVFSLWSQDTTVSLSYNTGDFTATINKPSHSSACWGALGSQTSWSSEFFTEYLCASADDSRNGYIPMSFTAVDCSNSSFNIIGGPSQEYGEDYVLKSEKIWWKDLALDGDIEPGDLLRVIYKAYGLSDTVRIKMSVVDDLLTIRGRDSTGWKTLAKSVLPFTDGTWNAAFYMNEPGADINHKCSNGRGFVSRFTAIADSFIYSDRYQDYAAKTLRQPVVFYEGEPT